MEPLVIVHKNKSRLTIGANTPTQLGGFFLLRREKSWHPREVATEILEKEIQPTEPSVVRASLPKLADGSLEVVGLDGDVEHIPVRGRFMEGGGFALGILPAVIHIVADPRGPAADLAKCERGAVARVKPAPAVVGDKHPAARFGGEIGILLTTRQILPALNRIHIAGDRLVDALGAEFVVVGDVLGNFRGALPRRLGIGSVKRNHLAGGHRIDHPGPSGFCVERHIHPRVDGELLQPHQVVRWAGVFVVELNAHNRATVFPKQAVNLFADMPVESGNGREVFGMLGPHTPTLRARPMRAVFNPIRKPSVAGLAIAPWAAAHDSEQSHLPAYLQKSAQVFPPLPIPLTLNFLVVVPKHIGGNNPDAAIAHLFQRLPPLLARVPRKMKLPDHWKPRPPIQQKMAAIDGNLPAIGMTRRTELEISRGGGSHRTDLQNPRFNLFGWTHR